MDEMKRELIGFLYTLQEKYDLKNSEVSQLALDVIKEKFSNAYWKLVPIEHDPRQTEIAALQDDRDKMLKDIRELSGEKF